MEGMIRMADFAPNLASVPEFQNPTAPGLGGPGGYPEADGAMSRSDGPHMCGLEGMAGLGEAKGV